MAGLLQVRVYVYPADAGGCGSYRLRWPAEALQKRGYDAVLDPPSLLAGHDHVGRVRGVVRPDCDVVVFQRPTARHRVDVIPLLQDKGIAVVVEVDDDFQCAPPQNVAARAFHPRFNPDNNWHHLARACRWADLVTVTTPALAERYGRHGRVAVIPNYVPGWYLRLRGDGSSVRLEHRTDNPEAAGSNPAHRTITIGWPGTPLTHPGDLDVVGAAVADVVCQTGSRFRAIGSRLTLDVLGIRDGEVVEWADLHDGSYQRAVASLDIGIVPLNDSVFNASKSWLKGLEMAALGVPFIASPVADYRRLRETGAGLLAAKPRAWASLLRRLLADEDQRAEVAQRGRDAAATLTIEEHCEEWWLAWSEARARRLAAAA